MTFPAQARTRRHSPVSQALARDRLGVPAVLFFVQEALERGVVHTTPGPVRRRAVDPPRADLRHRTSRLRQQAQGGDRSVGRPVQAARCRAERTAPQFPRRAD
jgi:hypothetical protein